jgi:hypothetical protein
LRLQRLVERDAQLGEREAGEARGGATQPLGQERGVVDVPQREPSVCEQAGVEADVVDDFDRSAG